jgi:glycogen synthase kinase 3 beta
LKQRLDDTGTALVSGLLQYDPRKRLSPLQTCAHGFYDEIRAEDLRVNGQKAPNLFDWTKEERAMMSQDPELVAKLNPPWREKS